MRDFDMKLKDTAVITNLKNKMVEIENRLTILEKNNNRNQAIQEHKLNIRQLKMKLRVLPITQEFKDLMLSIFDNYEGMIEKYEEQRGE